MSLIAIIGQFDIALEDAERVADLMRTMTTETLKEQGCIHYAFASDLLTPGRFQLSELWENSETLAAHGQTPHMAAFRAGLNELKVLSRVVTRYQATQLGHL